MNAYYIHNHYNNYLKEGPHIADLYTEQLIQRRYTVSKQRIKRKLKNIFEPNIPDIQNDEEFFKLLEDVQKNILPKAANQMVKQLETTNIKASDIYSVQNSVEQLEKVIQRFEIVLKQLTGSSFFDNPIPILTADLLKGSKDSEEFRHKYRELYIKNGTTFKVDGNYSRAIKSHKNEINILLGNINALNELKGNTSFSIPKNVKSDLIKGLLYSTFYTLNRMVGFVSEDIFSDALNKVIKDSVNDLGLSLVSETTGTEKGSIFNVKTEDISLNIDLSKGLKEGTNDIGKINIKLPGVTLKRTNIKEDINTAKIHIKTNTELVKLLNNSGLNSVKLKAFYNSYANYNRRISSKEKAELPRGGQNANAMNNMYNFFHASFLPIALGGSLDKQDFAYFMVINNEVFNIVDIIGKLADKKDDSFIISNLSTKQTAAKNYHSELYNIYKKVPLGGEIRSFKMLNYIQKLKVTMELSLALDKVSAKLTR